MQTSVTGIEQQLTLRPRSPGQTKTGGNATGAPSKKLRAIANAAPITPQPSGKMNSQSRTTFTAAAMMLHHMASFGAPSRRMANKATAIHNSNSRDGENQTSWISRVLSSKAFTPTSSTRPDNRQPAAANAPTRPAYGRFLRETPE